MTRAALTAALSLLLACETRPAPTPAPPENPIAVEIVNAGAASLFLGGNLSPFTIADAAGRSWNSAPGTLDVLCTECDLVCGMSIDPAPVYIEIPPGKRYPVSWDGRLYDELKDGCSCGQGRLDCMVMRPLPHASYTFTVRYTDQPPPDTALDPHAYSKTPRPDGTIRWLEELRLGLETLDLEQRFPLSYTGQRSIRLELR